MAKKNNIISKTLTYLTIIFIRENTIIQAVACSFTNPQLSLFIFTPKLLITLTTSFKVSSFTHVELWHRRSKSSFRCLSDLVSLHGGVHVQAAFQIQRLLCCRTFELFIHRVLHTFITFEVLTKVWGMCEWVWNWI